jgi:subtilisin family serine protease
MRRQVVLWAGLAVLAACAEEPLSGPQEAAPAPLLGVAQQGGALRDRYIVVFRDNVGDVDAEVERATRGFGAQVHYRYYSAIKGFAATLPSAALEGLRRNPNVSYIEADDEMSISTTQSGATWGLDRIDQASGLSGTYTYFSTGAGVKAYIIDTGILTTHADFENRASYGRDLVGGKRGANSDCNGHGTHVAGTVGGKTYGVAKGVSLVAVRVLDCRGSGTTSGVIAGVDWVASQTHRPAVANMSLGGGASTTLDNAVKNAVNKAGITFAVAAGNSSANACNYSPARVPEAITVGATTSTDARASYSNFGACLDIFAPGSSITSAWYTSNTATNTISGTSMASPHVAGVAALYLQGGNASPTTVRNALVTAATPGKVTSAGTGSPNLLLFTSY